MKYLIEIDCDNEAFGSAGDEWVSSECEREIARILTALALTGEQCGFGGRALIDANGNRVGSGRFVKGGSR
jgi:hypothetical protein